MSVRKLSPGLWGLVKNLVALVNKLGGNHLLSIGTLAISATPEDFKTTTTAYFRINGVQYSKAAADNIGFSAADTINTGTAAGFYWGAWLVQVTGAGTVSTKPAGGLSDQVYATEALAVAALPDPDANNAPLGYITIKAKTGAAWTANTDDMTPASDCEDSNFYDFATTGVPDTIQYKGGGTPS